MAARIAHQVGLHRLRERQRVQVRRVAIPAGLGRRFVLVSDIHADERFMPAAAVRDLVHLVNSVQGTSAVLVPGDFVGHDASTIEWCAAELGALDAPAFATFGNHDLLFERSLVENALRDAGLQVLVNQAVPLDDWMWIGGLDSAVCGRPDAARMLASVPAGAPCVVLGHEPWLGTLHDELLHVAGHTHHGQIRLRPLPWRYLPARSAPWPEGLYEVERDDGSRRWVYTTAGVGSTTIPLRVGCPPEIVVIDT